LFVEIQRSSHIQRLTYEEFEARIREGEIPAETRVRFEVVTGNEFVPAGQLELYHALVNPQSLAFRRSLTRVGVPIITAILVGVQLRIYLLSWAPGAELALQEQFTNWAPGILERGEIYRLMSYGLLHTSFTHLLFNLTFLAYTGYNLERAVGRANLLLLYFGSVFSGGLLSMMMAPDRPSLGASGGDFGLLAAAVVFGWKHFGDIPAAARKKFGWALVPYLGFSLLSGLSADNVDNWGHLGGLLGGTILMTLLAPEVGELWKRRNTQVRWGALVLLLATVIGLKTGGHQLVPLVEREQGGMYAPSPTYWREGWTFTGDRGWFSPTGEATMVVARTTHPRPLDADEATDALIARIQAGGKSAEVLSRQTVQLDGREARSIELRVLLSGEPQIIRALVSTRGVYAYRTQFQAVQKADGRYLPLMKRLFSQARIEDPEELRHARERAQVHPRSWQPAVQLGDAWYRAGQPNLALAEYTRALALSPDTTSAIVGRLKVHADYQLPEAAPVATTALQSADGRPRIIVAAADTLYAAGEYDQALQALDDAWAALPGDRVLRRARHRWGLPVD
jgi:membrane associated rhomboid family serine protease